MNVWPATVIDPLRAVPVFAATLNVTVPFPVDDAPAVIEIQSAPALAVHVHVDADAVTPTEPGPPVSPID